MDLQELSERLARLEAAEARSAPDAWPAMRVYPEMLAWNEPEPLSWEDHPAQTPPDDQDARDDRQG